MRPNPVTKRIEGIIDWLDASGDSPPSVGNLIDKLRTAQDHVEKLEAEHLALKARHSQFKNKTARQIADLNEAKANAIAQLQQEKAALIQEKAKLVTENAALIAKQQRPKRTGADIVVLKGRGDWTGRSRR